MAEGQLIKVLTDINSLGTLKDDWKRLAELKGNPLMTYEWFLACAEVLHSNENICVVGVYSDNRIHAIAPLVRVRQANMERLKLMGVDVLGEPSDLLFDDQSSLRSLINAVKSLKKPVILQRIPADSPVEESLRKSKPYEGIVIKRNSASSACIFIDSERKQYEDCLSARRRQDLRRVRRKLDKKGKVKITITCPEISELASLLQAAYTVENSGWKGKSGSSMSSKQVLGRFFEVYSALACRENILRICFLLLEDRPVAMLIGLEYAKRFWVLKIGYDEAYAEYSPGIQVVDETIKYSFDNQLESYEFLGSDDPWIHMWHVNLRQHISVGMYPANYSGLLALGSDVFRSGRNIVKRFVGSKR
jgi:CelD/BcsL family acetyltransferase involved in cellulose biosynthesis